MPTPSKTLYYPVWLSSGATPPYMIGKPCDSISEAAAERDRIMADYGARGYPTSFAAVMRFGDGEKSLLPKTIRPTESRNAVQHFFGIVDQFEAGWGKTT